MGFEPTQLALVELESTPLDHSGKVSCGVQQALATASWRARNLSMDALGFEPRAFRMRSGCDTTTPCAQLVGVRNCAATVALATSQETLAQT